jgi:hypothetical protein
MIFLAFHISCLVFLYLHDQSDISLLTQQQANLRRRSMSERSPSSLVDVSSSEDEHNHHGGSSATEKSKNATKRPRKEPLVDGSISEMSTPLIAFKSQENCSLYSYSRPSEKNILEVIPSSIGQTLLSEETLPEELLDGQLNAPTCGTDAGSACKTHPIAELRKKMVSARKNSAVQQTQERLLSVKAHKVKKDVSNSKGGEAHPIQELQEKHDAYDNVSPLISGIVASIGFIIPANISLFAGAESVG